MTNSIRLLLSSADIAGSSRLQGSTLETAVVDLQSCRGTESPYVMVSKVKYLDGLLILRPFKKSKICCSPSEDVRREFRRLDFLQLRTLNVYGNAQEAGEARAALDAISAVLGANHPDPISGDNADAAEDEAGDAAKLDRLQRSNCALTSALERSANRFPTTFPEGAEFNTCKPVFVLQFQILSFPYFSPSFARHQETQDLFADRAPNRTICPRFWVCTCESVH